MNPSPVSYTNIAEIYVYRGSPTGRKTGTRWACGRARPGGAVAFNDMLIAWKEGDVREARRKFEQLKRHEPEMIRTINMARLQRSRAASRNSPATAAEPRLRPLHEESVLDLSLTVQEREISEEAVLKELRLEIEAKRRLLKALRAAQGPRDHDRGPALGVIPRSASPMSPIRKSEIKCRISVPRAVHATGGIASRSSRPVTLPTGRTTSPSKRRTARRRKAAVCRAESRLFGRTKEQIENGRDRGVVSRLVPKIEMRN